MSSLAKSNKLDQHLSSSRNFFMLRVSLWATISKYSQTFEDVYFLLAAVEPYRQTRNDSPQKTLDFEVKHM